MVQLRTFLGSFLGPLIKIGLPLIGNVLKSPTKSVLVPLELTATASATDTAIQKNIFGSGITALISNLKWTYEWYYKST